MRGHWGIENSVHWTLDLGFHEDDNRVSVGKGAENPAVLRHIALNLVQQDRRSKRSIKQRRFQAALDMDYLHQVLVSPKPDERTRPDAVS